MSIGNIEPIPEGFLAKLLNAFGVQWTHLVLISGVAFSSFGLESYLDPGVWIIGTIASFSIAYIFRYSVSRDFPRTFFFALCIALFLCAGPVFVAQIFDISPLDTLRNWSKIATLYISLVFGIPLGIVILSYRRQINSMLEPLSISLENKIKHSITESPFVILKAEYFIRLTKFTEENVTFFFEVKFLLKNRVSEVRTYTGIFDPAGSEKRFLTCSIAGKPLNPQDPDRSFDRGLRLSHEAQAQEEFELAVSGEALMYQRDSEMVGTYLPCEQLTILLEKPNDEIVVNFQSLMREKIEPRIEPNGNLIFECVNGVLPFQGARIFWHPRAQRP